MREIVEAQRSLAGFITMLSLMNRMNDNDSIHPYHRIHNYETHAFEARYRSMVQYIAYAPLVAITQLSDYMEFTEQSKDWYEESKLLMDQLLPSSLVSQQRTKEPKRTTAFDASIYKLSNDTSTTYNDAILQAWSLDDVDNNVNVILNPRLHTSPPPSHNDRSIQNEDFFSNVYYKQLAEASNQLQGTKICVPRLCGRLYGVFVFLRRVHSLFGILNAMTIQFFYHYFQP
jgi:hypothetical protein